MTGSHFVTVLALIMVQILTMANVAPPDRRVVSALAAASNTPLGATTSSEAYVRRSTGVAISGVASTWWAKAEGKYVRSHRPKIGAVINFAASKQMVLGHVAVVTRLIDNRTIFVSHANWNLNGRAVGKIEHDVRIVDVSPSNTWGKVQVSSPREYELPAAIWPVHGFIYAERISIQRPSVLALSPEATRLPRRVAIGQDFLTNTRVRSPVKSQDPIGAIIESILQYRSESPNPHE